MEKKFTKGPWKLDNYNNLLTPNGSFLQAPVNLSIGIYKIEEAEANAKLISAAPDLLEALEKATVELKAVMSHCLDMDFTDKTSQGYEDYEQAISLAEQAIKKALE